MRMSLTYGCNLFISHPHSCVRGTLPNHAVPPACLDHRILQLFDVPPNTLLVMGQVQDRIGYELAWTMERDKASPLGPEEISSKSFEPLFITRCVASGSDACIE